MFWTILFSLGIAQGIFLISIISLKASKNFLASTLISVMVSIMIVTNLGYLVARTELINYFPQMFGVPFGMIFLFGPLFYFYCRSVTDPRFQWKSGFLLHFIPYFIQLAINLPFLALGKSAWIQFIEIFLAGDLPVRGMEKGILLLQDIHLLVYLIFTFRLIRRARRENGSLYIVPLAERLSWLSRLTWSFSFFLITVFVAGVFIVVGQKYIPITNYLYTIITSAIIYVIAYKTVIKPDVIAPDFVQKYKAYMQFMGEDGEKYFNRLKSLLSENKVFVDPDLTLVTLAESVGLPSHQVSKLINEKFGKSFNDLINEYRVNEFIARINNPQYQAYSVLGVAMDVGFNSKSSFNSTFKKITGKTPSAYRKEG
jgi:AraC-like DNA-binding protein